MAKSHLIKGSFNLFFDYGLINNHSQSYYFILIMIYRVITSIRQPFLQKYRSLNRFSYVASLDQSTTSTKLSIYKSNGTLIAKENISHTQICPHEGFLEHNPMEILNNVHLAIDSIVNQLKSVS